MEEQSTNFQQQKISSHNTLVFQFLVVAVGLSVLLNGILGFWYIQNKNLINTSQDDDTVVSSSLEDEETVSQFSDEPSVYRSPAFNFVFMYPSDVEFADTENAYASYGEALGDEVPYQKISLIDRGSITVQVWDALQSREIYGSLSECVDALDLAEFGTYDCAVRTADGKFDVVVSLIPHPDDLNFITSFVQSFYFTDKPVDTTHWQSGELSGVMLSFPRDWAIADDELAPLSSGDYVEPTGFGSRFMVASGDRMKIEHIADSPSSFTNADLSKYYMNQLEPDFKYRKEGGGGTRTVTVLNQKISVIENTVLDSGLQLVEIRDCLTTKTTFAEGGFTKFTEETVSGPAKCPMTWYIFSGDQAWEVITPTYGDTAEKPLFREILKTARLN